MINFIDRKGITPVIAVALLLVVAVSAVVVFQTWFGSYSSGLFSKVEKSSQFENINIQTVVGGSLYIKGTGDIVKVESNGKDCHISGVYNKTMNQIFASDCFVNGENKIVVYTKQNVYSKEIYLSDYKYKNPCPSGFILVPGNIDLGTSNFCVMKYEAKFKNLTGKVQDSTYKIWSWYGSTGDMSIVSSPNYKPIANINQTEARAACSSLGSGYHLITDAEWITIARLAESNPSNWANGTIDSNVSSGGGMYRGNVNLSDNISCGDGSVLDGNTAGTNCLVGSRNKRTLNISGNMIWDFSGNVWEWDNDTILASSRYYGGNNGWMSYNNNDGTGRIAKSPTFPFLKLPPNGWNANQGMGRYYDGASLSGTWTGSSYSGTIAGFLRGGSWPDGAGAGAFALDLTYAPAGRHVSYGFRCSYSK